MKIRKNDIFEGCRKGKAGQKRTFCLYLGVSDVQAWVDKVPHGMLYGLQPDGFLAGGGGGCLPFCRFFREKLSFGLWHESRDSRVCVCCAVDTGIWKPRVDTVDKMTKSKFPISLFGSLQKKFRFFFCGVQINFISLSSRR